MSRHLEIKFMWLRNHSAWTFYLWPVVCIHAPYYSLPYLSERRKRRHLTVTAHCFFFWLHWDITWDFRDKL